MAAVGNRSSGDSIGRRRKIGLVVPDIAGGGGVPAVAQFVYNVALVGGAYSPTIVSLSASSRDPSSLLLFQPGTWFRKQRWRSGDWHGRPYVHVGANFGEFEFQRYRLRDSLAAVLGDCDLIQVVSGSPAWANAVCGLGKPVSLQVATRAMVERRRRDARPRGVLGWWRRAMTQVTNHFDDRALARVDAVQVENPWMLEYVRNRNAGRRIDIRYAPPGVDDRLFQPLQWRDPSVDPYILCVGRLEDPRKNIDLLVDAYARLPERMRSRVRLVLAGSSAPRPSFWSRADALAVRDRIDYVAMPTRERLLQLYQRASVFALPSDEEGLGVVLLESMACGVPVVSTRSGGPDGVITDGKDGFLVPLDDAEAMADRLGRLLIEPALNHSMGREARRTIEARYAERVAGEVFLEVWDRLLAKAGKSSCAD